MHNARRKIRTARSESLVDTVLDAMANLFEPEDSVDTANARALYDVILPVFTDLGELDTLARIEEILSKGGSVRSSQRLALDQYLLMARTRDRVFAVELISAAQIYRSRGLTLDPTNPGVVHENALPLLEASIYLSDEDSAPQVRGALVEILARCGLSIEDAEVSEIGSWFQRVRVAFRSVITSPAGVEAAQTAAHAAEARIVLANDAQITAMLLRELPPLISSLDKTKDAAIPVGALLILKIEWTVHVAQLGPAQQLLLNHQRQPLSPHVVVDVLGLGITEGTEYARRPGAESAAADASNSGRGEGTEG
jgi:hypothetical protein